MDHEAEVIHEQMEDTRASLAEKLEKLEEKVLGTIENTTNTVTQTVATVTETVETVKEAVEGTVETVKGSVVDTVETVKHSLDVTEHVRNHPWLMFGSSVVAGFVAGEMLGFLRPQAGWTSLTFPGSWGSGSSGGLQGYQQPAYQEPAFQQPPAPVPREEPVPQRRQESGPSWLGWLGGLLGPELDKLKGLAIGVALGAVRDAVQKSAQGELASHLSSMIDGITTKLGGEVVHGPLFETGHKDEQHNRTTDGARVTSPM